MGERIDTGTIVRGSVKLLCANARTALLALAVLAGLSSAIDTFAPDNPGLNFVSAVAAVFAQYGVTRGALRAGRLPSGPGSGASFVGALILSGLGIALGFVFLILPGIYLWARWSLVSPLIVGEGMGATEALRTSWTRTQAVVAPISGALLVLTVPVILLSGIPLAFYPDSGPVPLGQAILANLCLYGWQLLIWHCAVAIHALIEAPGQDLEQVFA